MGHSRCNLTPSGPAAGSPSYRGESSPFDGRLARHAPGRRLGAGAGYASWKVGYTDNAMARSGRQFEHYATRVTCVLLAALIAWSILHGKGLVYAFYGFFLVQSAIRGVDFTSSQNWWITLIFLLVADIASGFSVYTGRGRPLQDRLIVLLLTGCFLAQTLLLLSGRWRRVWRFARISAL